MLMNLLRKFSKAYTAYTKMSCSTLFKTYKKQVFLKSLKTKS